MHVSSSLLRMLPHLLVLSLLFERCLSNPDDLSCTASSMNPGTSVSQHGTIGAYGSSAASISILRSSTSLGDGDLFVPGETLTISLSGVGGNEYAIAVHGGATFSSGTRR